MPRRTAQTISDTGETIIRDYIYEMTQKDLNGKTLQGYEGDLRHFGCWFETIYGSNLVFTPDQIVPPTLTSYRTWCQEQGLKPGTFNRRLTALKKFFAHMARAGQITVNPAEDIRFLSEVKQPPRHLTDKEVGDFMAAVVKHGTLRDRALFTLLAHTGIRSIEACNLKVNQVFLARGDEKIEVLGKRNKMRYVPVNATASKVLTEYLKTLPTGTTYLFPGRGGRRLTERGIRFLTAEFARVAGVVDLSPHDFRHHVGYRLAAAGVPLQQIADLLGHERLDTTRIYTQATRNDLRNAMAKLAWQ